MTQIAPKIIRQIFVLLLILLIGSLIFSEMLPYLSGVLGAITFYILLRKPMRRLVKTYKWKSSIAALTLMLASFIVVMVPLSGFGIMLGNKISDVAANSEKVMQAFQDQVGKIKLQTGLDINSQMDTEAITTWLSDSAQSMVGNTFNLIIAIGLMYFMLYFMLTNRQELRESLREYIPMDTDNINEIGREVQTMVKSNAIGIPLVAIAQGLIALIGFLIFGIEEPLFWFVIVTIGSMIPFVGTLVGILPVFILTLSNGDSFQAWGILIYGLVVVGSTDNIIRLFVLKKLDNVHPLITLIGVIVGVPLFGFIGLIFGPLLISMFMALVKIYKEEYGKADKI
ncbi:AI-2E family transporter [Winogradskyella endarachnes]|uniref:AI-2E family transporter n=1 Tax=Winogradskyella endarachnes TaxID=2681965 RepID=A0A6L6U9E4_9FLAO|nr:AI-2E family transporter [Winogradskyella endarachnes]MUU78106.1 AI-2E family transporter [Winogradskyella endarachnes]